MSNGFEQMRAKNNNFIPCRVKTFKAMLRQECGWFDDENNAIGSLSAHLSGDAANVQNV